MKTRLEDVAARAGHLQPRRKLLFRTELVVRRSSGPPPRP